MATQQEFSCEVCGLMTTNPTQRFVIRCGDSDLTEYRWNKDGNSTRPPMLMRHRC
jgi:hypothetical protein